MTKFCKYPIFITGNGVIGHRVAMRLNKGGYPVRVGTPDSETASELVSHGVEVIPFSWEDETSYESALAGGVKQVFCVIDPLLHKDWAVHFPKFFDCCKKKKIEHFVKVSFYHALTATRARVMKNFHIALPDNSPFSEIPMMKEHADCDELLMKSIHVDYTFLFATHKMSDVLLLQDKNLKDDDIFYGASCGKEVSYCSPNDIAAAAVHVLTDPKSHKRVGYSLTGPEPVTDKTVADSLSKAFQKKVNFVDLDPSEFDAEEAKEGKPQWLVEDLVPLEKLKASGIETKFLSHDFESLCGRKPETWETYLASRDDMTPAELHAF